jgi:lipopolysaccharide/colanic/teichoic acid biosynthesis glycosyltransferase
MKHRSIPIVKRTMDIIFGLLFLVVAIPIMLLIAIAIKLTSDGPIFYRQRRTGALSATDRGCPVFYVYKFRTMCKDAEATTGAVLSQVNDCRITPIGAFLRKTRLDEVPQFFNVIKGDMSIVGPRPERPELMGPLGSSVPFFEERLRCVKPGITGLAQIKLKYDGHLPKDSELAPLQSSLVNPYKMSEMEGSVADGMRLKMLYDLSYTTSLERFGSFIAGDLSIMFKTPFVMFFGRTGQ